MLPVAVELGLQVETADILHIQRETEYLIGGGQAILDLHKALVGAVLHVPRSPNRALRQTLGQEDRLVDVVRLVVGGDVDAVVVGHQQPEFEFFDVSRRRSEGSLVLGTVQLISQGDGFAAVRGAETFLLEPSLDQRIVLQDGALAAVFVAQAPAVADPLTILGFDDQLLQEERRSSFEVIGRIVTQADAEFGDVRVLRLGERTLQRVPLESLAAGARVEDIHIGSAQPDEIANLRHETPPQHVGDVRLLIGGAGVAPETAGPRGQDRGLVFVGRQVGLNTVEGRLGQGQRRQRGADGFADRDAGEILPLGVRGYHQATEELAELAGLEQPTARGFGLCDRPVEDQPSFGEETAVYIVEIVTFDSRTHVPLVGSTSVVGVFPLIPLILVEELLRHVPFLDRRIQRIEHDPGAIRLESHLSAPPHAQSGTEIFRGLRRACHAQDAERNEHTYFPGHVFPPFFNGQYPVESDLSTPH